MSAKEPWEPLDLLDFFVLGMVSTFQVAALGACIHLVQWRAWPPYLTKNVNVVIISTLSGILWTGAKAIEVGFFRRSAGDVLAACDFERLLAWGTLLVHVSAFFVRVYRMKRILIEHDEHMWRTEHQILFLSGVSLIPVVATWLIPGTALFDERSNTCASDGASMYPTLGMNALGLYGICYLWFVCIRRLKTVRKQFNEYHTLTHTLMCLTVALLSYAIVVVVLLEGRFVVIRRVAIFYPVITTYILLWGSIREPFMKKILGDDEYLWSYTKGFSELPSPAQLKASLAEQLSVEQLRTEFRRYIKTKVAQELVDFYLDSLDREEVSGFFERQAVTMRIVDRFIREDSLDQVNISQECRDGILATDVTAYDIFDEARKEVLAVMETNFQRDFVETEGFRRIANASEVEQREIRLLKADGILPFTPTTPLSPLSPASLHPTRLLSALRSLPLLRWFGAPDVPDAASTPASAPAVVAVAADASSVSRHPDVHGEGDHGGREGSRQGRRPEGRGGALVNEVRREHVRDDLAAGKGRGWGGGVDARVHCSDDSNAGGAPDDNGLPSGIDSSSPDPCASPPAAIGAVPRTKVVMEEGWGQMPTGLTAPVANDESNLGDGGFATPLNGDGCTTDGEDGANPPDGFTTPIREDDFRTPV